MTQSSKPWWAWSSLLYLLSILQFTTLTLCAAPTTINADTSPSFVTVYTSVTAKPTPTKSSSTSETSSAAAQTHTVSVGNGDHKFSPDIVQAKVGDIVEFDFFPVNHSVVRAEYQHPCIPYEMTGENKVGFFSGFHPVSSVQDNPPKFTVRVNDTLPIFFYCSAPGSCINYGMVGVINPNESTSLAAQKQMARDSSYMLQPGEPFPAEGSPSSNPSSSSNHSSKLSTGAIVGIAIAAVTAVVLGCLLFFFWGRFRGLEDEIKRKDSTTVRHTSPRSPAFHGVRQHGQPRSPFAQTPTTAHAMPPATHPTSPSVQTQPEPIHSAHFNTTPTTAYLPQAVQWEYGHVAGGGGGGRGQLARHESTRSVGGTFDLSPTTGYYTRRHQVEEAYKSTAPYTSDMTSPVDPKIIPVGPYGRQMLDLQRMNQSPVNRSPSTEHNPAPAYFEVLGGARPQTFHVNECMGPAEMPDTSHPPTTFI